MIGSAGLSGDFAPGQRAALQPVLAVGHRVLVGDLGLAVALHAHRESGGVHHDEHGPEALVRLADQIPDRAVVVHHAGGVAVDAHLLLDGATAHRVAVAETGVGVDQELGHNEQADALDPVRAARNLGQHQMDDVFGQVVLAGGDEDLGAGDTIGSVRLRFGPGAQQTQVGAAVRFGQVHGAGPLAGDHLG